MALIFWIVVLSAFLGFFAWATNLLKVDAENEKFDAGLAILEFGRAYPDEAIRHVLISDDGDMVFLRLWTGRTGLMRRVGNRELCYLVDPQQVRVSADPGGKALTIDFPGHKAMSGTYAFRTEKEAAEAGLWLLGSVTASISQEFALPSHA
ncbi:hypothetical protein [Rhizobium sp.]